MRSSVANVSLSKRSIATQRSLSLPPSFFWDGGGEGRGADPPLGSPNDQCTIILKLKRVLLGNGFSFFFKSPLLTDS